MAHCFYQKYFPDSKNQLNYYNLTDNLLTTETFSGFTFEILLKIHLTKIVFFELNGYLLFILVSNRNHITAESDQNYYR